MCHSLRHRRCRNLFQIIFLFIGNIHKNIRLLMRAVGVQKRPRQIHDFLPAPFEHQPGLPGDYRHRHRLQIFLSGIAEKCVYIRG